MAVYQGARRRSLPLGLDGLGAIDAPKTRRAPAGDRAEAGKARAKSARRPARALARRARPSSVGIALGAIAIVFGAAFLSLSQSVRVAATSYDIVRLVSEHDRLEAIRQDLQSDVERLRSEPAIRKQALDTGLGQLGAPLIVPAR